MNIAFFETSYQAAARAEKAASKEGDRLSLARLASFCLILFAASMGYDLRHPAWYILTCCDVLAFLFFLKKHRQSLHRQVFLRSRQTVLQQYSARFSTDWHAFRDNGNQFMTEEATQARDLDILGKNSLYQYLCAANTSEGKKKLAALLLQDAPAKDEIVNRQAAVRELTEKLTFSLELQTRGNLLSQSAHKKTSLDSARWLPYLETPPTVAAKGYSLLRLGLPIATLWAIGLAASGFTPVPAIALIFLQLTLSGFSHGKNTASLQPLFALYQNMRHYEQIFSFLESASFSSPYLRELQKHLRTDGGACRKIRRLSAIGECVNMRYNFIFYLIGNSLLLWDFQCIHAFSLWRRAYGADIGKWFAALGEIEALLSLSILGQVKKTYKFPLILSDDAPRIQAKSIYHPLLEEGTAIANPVSFTAQTCIITGSNMSGKTTFLRSVGINAILAYAGAPVCAEQFEISLMRLFTSIRVEDDISKGISTFYAELLRIKAMVVYSAEKRPMLVLIDEIFKGTNSADRIVGATATVKKLTRPWNITLVSTHDFELCDLARRHEGAVNNYHFSEFYTNDEIHFDYRLKSGRCRTTNAKYLLRMAGIL